MTADESLWKEDNGVINGANLPEVELAADRAVVLIPTNDQPRFVISLSKFSGGRRLLSDEISMLEAVALLTSRKIDALRVTHERCEQELREQEFAQLATEAQLTALRSQINPHFLFNALTTIGYLIQTSPEKAVETLMVLTKLLRSVLKTVEEFCTVGEELSLINNYLDIERARFEERLQVEIDVPNELEKLKIPSLILQPLVENAIKHAVSVNKVGGTVKISAEVERDGAEQFLKLRVSDSGAGGKTNGFSHSNGIGLGNVEQRLKTYYKNDASLEIRSNSETGTVAEIRLPIVFPRPKITESI